MSVRHNRVLWCMVMIAWGLGALLVAAAAPEPRWPSLGGDYRRSGQSRDLGPLAGAIRWTFETGGAVISSVTVGFDSRIHVACEDGKLYTLNSEGKPLWVLDVNSPLMSAPSLGSDGSLYVGGRSGQVHAVNPDGSLRWTFKTADFVYSSPAVGANGDVYVGSSDGTLYALHGDDGTELWRFTTKGSGRLPAGAILASPSIGPDGTVYIGGLYDPNLYALDPADGSVKWACRFPPNSDDPSTGGWPFASPVVAEDGTIYQTLLYDSHLYAIDPTDGTIRWAVDLCDSRMFGRGGNTLSTSDGWSESVLGPDGTIYVSLDDPYLRAVDPSGVLMWVTQLGEVGGLTLTVDSSGIVYAAAEDGHIYVVTPGSLTIAQFTTGGWPAFPVIIADDLLILADSKDYSSLNAGGKNSVWAISLPPPPPGGVRR
jgi:outer membrane protein assembly factor BamB